MFTTQISMQSLTRRVCLPYAILAVIVGLWTTPAAAVYLTVPYQIEYYRAFSGNYSINIRKDGLAFGDALIYSLAVTPMSAAVSNVKANGLCIQFTVDGSKLAQDFNTTVLQYAVTHESTTGGSQTSGGILDLRASNTGSSPPNSQDCGVLPETNHVPSFNSTISTQVAPGRLFSRNLSQSVSDADPADILTVSLALNTVAKYGTVTLSGNVLNYTANTSVPSGSTETLGLVVSDGRGGIGTSFATFTINTAPVAKDATATAVTGQPTTIDVSKLVSDGDGDALAVYALTTPMHGTATFNGLMITYTSTAAYSGPDEFTYWITDGKGGAVSAKVSATVSAPNLPPVANNGAIRIQEDTPADIDLATLASDPEGSFSVSAIPTAPQHGTTHYAGTHITYTPALNYYGSDTFTYQVADPQGASATATITMTIAPVNDSPVIRNNPLGGRVITNGALNINLSDNVSDVDGDIVIVSDATAPAHGQITLGTGLSFTYTPTPGYIGPDQFNYYVTDQTGTNNNSAMGTMIIDVGKANTAPAATNVTANAIAGQPVVINLTNAVSDQDKDVLSITVPERTAHGSLSATGLIVTYTPDPGFVGDDPVVYTVRDGYGGSATATITLKISSVSPLAQAIKIKVIGGDVQLARLNSNVALSVQVTDETNQNLAGASVSWSATDQSSREQPGITATDLVTDGAGIARATLTTSSTPTSYAVTVTVLLPQTVASQQAIFTIATGLHTLTRPGTPEGAFADVLDTMCPALQAAANTLTPPQQALLARCNEILNAATDGNDAQILTALRALAPDEVAAQGRIGNSFAQQQLSNIGARLSALRSGATGLGLSGLSFNIKGRSVPGSVFAQAAAADVRTDATADLPQSVPKWSGFISGTVGGGDKNQTTNEAGFDFHTRGLTAGADYRYSGATVFGGALGYARSDVNLDANGGGLDTAGLSLSLYGTYYHAQNFYLDAVLNYARNDYDQTRNIDYYVGSSHIQKSARSGTGGKLLALSVGGGYEFTARSGASTEVSLRLHRIASTIDGYTETGADALNLALRDQYIQVFSSSLGTRGSWPLSLKWGVLIPQLDLSWEHELNDGTHQIKGSFVNDPFATPFAFKTDDPDRNYFQLGLGASAIIPGGKTAFLQYQTNLGRDHYRDYSVALGARVELR